MTHINSFNEAITYSGKNPTTMPVIGSITTREFSWGTHIIPAETLSVVEIIPDANGAPEIYVINRWYKPKVPQLVHKELVDTWTPNPYKN